MANSTNTQKSMKMETMKMGKLLITMSIPAMLSMLVQALYSIVDSIYVKQYSDAAFTAINLSYPLAMVVIAFAVGIGVGANAQIAKRLGEKNPEQASVIARNAFFISVVVYLFFVVVAFTLVEPFITLYTSDQAVIDYAVEYLTIYLGVGIFTFLEIAASKMLQATGNMRVPMISQIIGAGVNIVLDPIFIFGLNIGGLQIVPSMGVSGAAIATVLGQMCACIFVFVVFRKTKQEININFKGFKPSKEAIKDICRVGVPTTVMNAVGSFVVAALNGIIATFAYGVDALGIYFKVQSFIFMPVFGLMQGAMPILGYNYGANNKERFKKCFWLTVLIAAIIMFAGFMFFLFGTEIILGIFTVSAEMAPTTIVALRVMSFGFLPAAVGITMTTMLQSIGCGAKSLAMSLLRQLVVLLPAAYIFSLLWGLDGAWWSYLTAEIVTLAVFSTIAIRSYKMAFSKLQPMEKPQLAKS